MNLLQSFMGCMYPDIIRTDSIESMEDNRFPAANIDERDAEISRGELQVTNDELIYFRPAKSPFRWPLNSIRRWGYVDESHKFVFEAGRKSPTGENIYAFRLHRGQELVAKLDEKTRQVPQQQQQHHHHQHYHQQTNNGNPTNDVDTSGDQEPTLDQSTPTRHQQQQQQSANRQYGAETADPRPLSYSVIDHQTTKALNESAQAHAANRDR